MAEAALKRKTDAAVKERDARRDRSSSSSSSDDDTKKKEKTNKPNPKSPKGKDGELKPGVKPRPNQKPVGKPVMVPQSKDSSDDESKKKKSPAKQNTKPAAKKPAKKDKDSDSSGDEAKKEKKKKKVKKANRNTSDSDSSDDEGQKQGEKKKKKKQKKKKKEGNDGYTSDSFTSDSSSDDEKKKKKKEGDYVKHHKEMKKSMMKPRLKASCGSHDNAMMKRAIADAQAVGLDKNDPDLVRARNTSYVLDQRQRLAAAVKKRDSKAIQKELDHIKPNLKYSVQYCSFLQREVYEAECQLEEIERAKRKKAEAKMVMDRNTMFAIKSLQSPPKEVHEVMQGSLLLLGCDMKQTENWGFCQQMCHAGTTKRIMDFKVESVYPDIAATARSVLAKHTLDKLDPISHAAATFYVWAMGTVDECNKKNGKGKVVSPKRQAEIFKLPPPQPKSRSSSVATTASRKSSISSIGSKASQRDDHKDKD